MNRYILVHTWYVQVNGVIIHVFVANSAMQPCATSELEHGDPDVPLEDEELFETPYANAMEETISKFVDRLEQPERRGFTENHTFATHWFSSVPLQWRRNGVTRQRQPDLNEKMCCDGTYSYVMVYTGIYHVCQTHNLH